METKSNVYEKRYWKTRKKIPKICFKTTNAGIGEGAGLGRGRAENEPHQPLLSNFVCLKSSGVKCKQRLNKCSERAIDLHRQSGYPTDVSSSQVNVYIQFGPNQALQAFGGACLAILKAVRKGNALRVIEAPEEG